MKTNVLLCRTSFPLGFLLGAFVAALPLPAPTAEMLTIQKQGNQVAVGWPSGLSLVQPQKASNLNASAFQDYGAATTATNLLDPVGGQAYYRLRYLAPSITAQPVSTNTSTGQSVTFSVAATGTAPIGYQWRREGTNLPGQTAATLLLTGVAPFHSGSYVVVLTNRAGAITSAVASLTVTSPPVPLRGIYMGKFTGQTDNGGVAALVTASREAVILGYYTAQDQGLYVASTAVTNDGSFRATPAQGGTVAGTFDEDNLTGALTNSVGMTSTFSGSHKADSGIHQANAGLYVGTYDGVYSGNGYIILAADGTAFIYITSPVDGDGAAYGTINEANAFYATTVPDAVWVSGTLNPSTHQITGTYGLGGTTAGTFTVTRTLTP